MSYEEEDFMGGGESLKFEGVGSTNAGKVLSIKSVQDMAPDGTAKTWPDGQPKKVFKWLLEVPEEVAEGGQATLWVRGNMVKVLREAAAKAGAKCNADLIGAQVSVKHHAVGEPKTKGFQGAKLYQAAIKLASPEERAKMASAVETPGIKDEESDYNPYSDK